MTLYWQWHFVAFWRTPWPFNVCCFFENNNQGFCLFATKGQTIWDCMVPLYDPWLFTLGSLVDAGWRSKGANQNALRVVNWCYSHVPLVAYYGHPLLMLNAFLEVSKGATKNAFRVVKWCFSHVPLVAYYGHPLLILNAFVDATKNGGQVVLFSLTLKHGQ